ncbi:MAG: FAD-dependent oxidoreductase, partial [Myxococcota bacterium]
PRSEERHRETFGDCRRMVIYGQRTADDRMVFGCRGPYLFGSGVRNRFDANDSCFRRVEATLHKLFPVLAEASISHRWAGVLGIPRDFKPTVGFDRKQGLGFAGGYVGEGVAASNLAGRILADLCLERASDLVDLPLVGGDFRRWELEPLRWLGVNGIRRLGEALDSAELGDRRSLGLGHRIFESFVKS